MAKKKAAGKNTASVVRRKYRPPTDAEIATHRAELEREAKEREARERAKPQTPEELKLAREMAGGRRLLDRLMWRDGSRGHNQ